MIVENTINIKVSNKTISHYKKWYNNISSGDNIEILISQLPINSAVKLLVKCDICDNEKIITYQKYNKNISKYDIYTCKKCFNFKSKKTNLEKYGVENYNNSVKSKRTCLEKYGVDNVSKLNDIKLKKEKTTFNNYKVLNPMQSNEIKLKFKNTMNDRFNGILMQSEKIKEKIKETNLKNHGFDNPFSFLEIKDKIKKNRTKKILKLYENNNIISLIDNIYTFKCDCKKNHNFNIVANILYNRKISKTVICTVCNPIGSFSNSGYETQLHIFIKNNCKINIIYNDRTILNPYELDIYIPDLKIAFEFNGVYWHNELHKENNYHLNKTELCEKQGIQLIHIWEDDWLYKQEIVKSIILNKLGKNTIKLYARKCEIKEIIDNKLVREFLDTNHIQGFVGSKVKIGLFYNDELVSLMTFGNRRIAMGKKSTNKGEYELLRFCNKLNTNVVGGASRLFKYFMKNYKPNEISTYADRSFSQGKLYETLGFKYDGKTQPNYYYIIDGIRHHRFNFRKDLLVKQGFDKNKTEHQIMIDRKIYRIYDSGNLKFKI